MPDLTDRAVEAWLGSARKEVSPRTIRKLLFVGGAVCERAQRDYPGFTANPFRSIEKGIKADRPVIEVFTEEEAAAIVRAAENEQEAAIFLLAFRQGLRRGEIPALLVRDVEFEDPEDPGLGRRLHVRRNFVQGVVTTPKGKRERSVPLNKSVARALNELLRERGDPPGEELLFPAGSEDATVAFDPENLLGRGHGANVDGLIDPDALSQAFRVARDAAGVRKLLLKHTRHTYCSRLAARGVHVTKIQEWAGHVSRTTTQAYMVFAPSKDDADTVDRAFGEHADRVDEAFGEAIESVSGDELAELQRQLAKMAETLARVQAVRVS